VDGDYILRLTVSDGRNEDSDNVMITAVQAPAFDLHPETIHLKSHGGGKSVTGVLKSKDIRSFQVFMDTDLVVPGGTFVLYNEYLDPYGNLVAFEIFNLDHEGSYVKLDDCDEDEEHHSYVHDDDENDMEHCGKDKEEDEDDDVDDDEEECMYTLTLKFDRNDILAGFDAGDGSWTISGDTDLTSILIKEAMEIGTDVNRVLPPRSHDRDKEDDHGDDDDHGKRGNKNKKEKE